IKDYSNEEDVDGAINEIVEDIKTIAAAEQDQYQKSLEYELNDENTNDMDDDDTKNNKKNNEDDING
ncbi:MAG: hypothetical protein N4A54_07720, partial [Peptostreptococcaceae bacterium]|nr:hypothetical protein [Peptostreptococcaceae bacterium]